MNRTISCLIVSMILSITLVSSCKKKSPICDGTNPKYNSDIKTIIDKNCTNSGCHNSGSGYGDFTSYSGLKSFLISGKFKSSVLDNQTMPKGVAKLSKEELNKIKCWQENNYPEN